MPRACFDYPTTPRNKLRRGSLAQSVALVFRCRVGHRLLCLWHNVTCCGTNRGYRDSAIGSIRRVTRTLVCCYLACLTSTCRVSNASAWRLLSRSCMWRRPAPTQNRTWILHQRRSASSRIWTHAPPRRFFALARTALWIAHAIEEYSESPLRFRPRADYIGPTVAPPA